MPADSTDIHFIQWTILILCLAAILITVYAVFIRRRDFTRDSVTKWLLLITFVIISPFVYILSFGMSIEETKPVSFCNSCHIMEGYVTDLKNPRSDHIASLHYRVRWIAKDQCYQCHTDYGIQGTIDAKIAGIRHIWSYYVVGYDTPLEYRGVYNNENCLMCHAPVEYYQEVTEHVDNRKAIENNEMSCFGMDCHVSPHPEEAWRTEQE